MLYVPQTLMILLVSTSVDSLDTRLANIRIRLEELEVQEAETEDFLLVIHDELRTARALYLEYTRQESSLDLLMEDVENRAGWTDSARVELRENIAAYVIYIYSHRKLLGPEMLFGCGGLTRVLRREAYLSFIAAEAARECKRLDESTDSLNRYSDSITVLHQRITLLRENMSQVQARIHLEEARQAVLRLQIQEDIVAAQESSAVLEAERRRLASLVENLRSSSSSPSVLSSFLPATNSYFDRNRGSVSWPVHSGQISRNFGIEVHPLYGTETISDGICITTIPGSEITSVRQGKVLHAGEFLSMGQMVIIDHLDGFYTVYGYMNELEVSADQNITTGQRLGISGGLPGGGNGVYFEIRCGGQPIDPTIYLEVR